MVLMSLVIKGKVKKTLMFPGVLEYSVFYLEGFWIFTKPVIYITDRFMKQFLILVPLK